MTDFHLFPGELELPGNVGGTNTSHSSCCCLKWGTCMHICHVYHRISVYWPRKLDHLHCRYFQNLKLHYRSTSLHQLWSTRLMQKSLGQASLAILLHVFHLLEKYTWRNGIFHKTKNTAAAGTEFISVWIVCYVCAHISMLRSVVAGCGQRQALAVKSTSGLGFQSCLLLCTNWWTVDPIPYTHPQF
jgi:hypothetical protein